MMFLESTDPCKTLQHRRREARSCIQKEIGVLACLVPVLAKDSRSGLDDSMEDMIQVLLCGHESSAIQTAVQYIL